MPMERLPRRELIRWPRDRLSSRFECVIHEKRTDKEQEDAEEYLRFPVLYEVTSRFNPPLDRFHFT
jgi:hypothetical protein